MKNIYLPTIITCLSLLITISQPVVGQETSCDSTNNELTSKFRFLGGWDADGSPEYLEDTQGDVTDALINYVVETLPESVSLPNSDDQYFTDDVQLNTELNEASEVYLTMVHEGAGWKNTLGYYTYDIDSPPVTVYDIDSLVILFPNVSQPNAIKPGDKVLLGEFPANTGIGYFLIAQGWVGDTICLTSHMVFSDPHLNTFTTEEYQQQTVLLNYEQEEQLLLCFEDIKRPGGDNDFNDAVFYITAEPGAIDTTNIPKIPTAFLSGDTTLCDINSPAKLQIDLTGQAPWTIVYNNGVEDVKIKNIKDPTYVFETVIVDTARLVSVEDSNKPGIVDGEAIVKLSEPIASLSTDDVICGGGEDGSGFIVQLDGEAPFNLTFKVDNDEKTFENILENQVKVIGEVGDVIELISMNDKYCSGEIVGGEATIQSYINPSLLVDGNGSLCGDAASTVFDLDLNGGGPWVLNYTLNDEEVELAIESSEYQLEISEPGLLTFNSIENENCVTTLLSEYVVEENPLPTAMIKDYSNNCGEGAVNVNIALTGQGPWNVHYSVNGENMVSNADADLMSLNIDQSGAFELIAVEDANCENTAEGSIDLEIKSTPSALISGDASICHDEEAMIVVELTGVAPFMFVYFDGETETAITTEESIYEFSTTEFKTYTLVRIDDAYCSGTVDGMATISDGSEDIQVEIDTEDTSCFGEEIALSLVGETDNLTVLWTTEGNGTFSNSDQLETTYSPAANETGVVVFYAEVDNGCSVKTVSKEVTIIDEIDATFDISPNKDLLTNSQITFTPSNNSYDEYSWDFDDENTSNATIASHEYSEGGIFNVELVVSLSGCEGSGIAELKVLSKDELYVPNVFSPDAQHQENQVVKVYGNNIDESDFYFRIVNRWGKTMYQTNSFSEANTVGWNGVNNNNNEEQEMNVFTYVLKGKFLEGEPFEKTGKITQVK